LNNIVLYSKLLRKPETLKTVHDVDKEEWKQIDEDLKVTANVVYQPVYLALCTMLNHIL